jgi:hypothetical protein
MVPDPSGMVAEDQDRRVFGLLRPDVWQSIGNEKFQISNKFQYTNSKQDLDI